MIVSFIIPTKNEELWLPTALSCVAEIACRHEIIVDDANSCDQTCAIAADGGCRVVSGGLPAFGRNAGARVAKGTYLMFVDADVKLNRQALEAGVDHIRAGAAGVFFRYEPDTDSRLVKFAYSVADVYFRVLSCVGIIRGMGPVIIARRACFEASGGFPEETAAAEDVEFIRRLALTGPVIYERRYPILISARRFRAEKPLIFMVKAIIWGIARAIGLRSSIIRYQWHNYDATHRDPARGW